ncbi:mechanosensitive ion channel domain-containing protein [uncultured Alistipes sp.]|jgi:hypothetical protein|uniref:mechanosensitive ion channel family protein n=1 Tax=uncultured Alistipes sp. TaxID=538949 RepID=UPI0025E7AE5E|nr:mechanosensitive ion channel domain-containing protein [uncultured Alistipes sp.]
MDLTSLLNKIGVHSPEWISTINVAVTVFLVALVGFVVYIVARKWLARLVIKLVGKTAASWDDLMFNQKFFNRLGALLMPIVIAYVFKHISFEVPKIVIQLTYVWITVAFVMMVTAILNGINAIYESYAVSRDRPIKVFIQLIEIFLWCAVLMITISIFTGVNVGALLGGLTAFAAVLMLIFQDSILGFVAGIQFSANNMVRVGDWIVMPSRGVDGDVVEISLTTVKVQNWDKTITTIPTHRLVSESFTNWRGMEESGGRRIKRSVNIDVGSIRYLTAEEIETLRNSSLLGGYMEVKLKEIAEYNAGRAPLDQRRLTNIGTFREYLESWLANNPNINQNMTHMVRQLQPGPTGLPVEIYCFSARQAWIAYENIQSDIFDHIFAIVGLFHLRAYQYGSGVIDPN